MGGKNSKKSKHNKNIIKNNNNTGKSIDKQQSKKLKICRSKNS